MKILKSVVVIIGSVMFAIAEDASDPFTTVEPKPVDRSSDEKSSTFISSELLKAFGEKRLDEGTGKDSPMIRITVLRSFHAPLIFKWYPEGPDQESLLQVKRLKFAVNEKGERTYKGLDLNQKLKIRPSQEQFLKTLYGLAPLQALPQAYWTPEALDGSHWIYEAAAENSSIVIARRNPVDPLLEGSKVTPKRLSHELQLTGFALMLWALSGIDEEPY